MSGNKEALQGVIKFAIKVLVLGLGLYYFKSRIFPAVDQNDLQGAAIYSTIATMTPAFPMSASANRP